MAAELAEKFVLAFKDVSWKIFFALSGLRSNSRENEKKNFFLTFLGLKDCVGFKADERYHDIR